MQHLFDKTLVLVKEFQLGLYVIIAVAACVIGVSLCLGDESATKARKRLPWVLLGALLIAGAVTLGAEYAETLTF